ncbi:hypothetical protein ACC704_38275, partial [Rhizobium johnstonii]|uniref:hypothetical protein n=1 Tax=Rhizobium johnstonii TaxID=3019933 RepID=UPI003F9A1125
QLEMATPGEAPSFVARGTIDADRIGEFREESQGFEIFADPEIGLLAPYCGSAAFGAVADVAKNLDLAALAKKVLDGSK